MPSQAWRELEEVRLPEVHELTTLDPSRRKGAHSDPVRVNAINRAAVLLLSAHLQGFLEDLVVEVVDHLNGSGIEKASVPTKLMAAHVERHIEHLSRRTELLDRIAELERLFEEHDLYWTDCTVSPDKLTADSVTRHIGNPWPHVIRRVFKLLGAADPFEDPSIDDARDLAGRLKELVGKRNDIAHGNGAPSLTYEHLDRFTRAVREIARVLDDQAADLVQDVCRVRTRPWA